MDRPHIDDVISLSFRHGQRTELLSCDKDGRVKLWHLVLLQGKMGLHQRPLLQRNVRGCHGLVARQDGGWRRLQAHNDALGSALQAQNQLG